MPTDTHAERATIERIADKDRALPEYLDALLYLGIEHDDMHDAVKMNRMKEVLDYAYQFKDGLNVIRRVVLKAPQPDRVNRAWEYVHLRQEHSRKMAAVQQAKESIDADELNVRALQQDIESLEK